MESNAEDQPGNHGVEGEVMREFCKKCGDGLLPDLSALGKLNQWLRIVRLVLVKITDDHPDVPIKWRLMRKSTYEMFSFCGWEPKREGHNVTRDDGSVKS